MTWKINAGCFRKDYRHLKLNNDWLKPQISAAFKCSNVSKMANILPDGTYIAMDDVIRFHISFKNKISFKNQMKKKLVWKAN